MSDGNENVTLSDRTKAELEHAELMLSVIRWAGGAPSDQLRAVRECIEKQSEAARARTIHAMMRTRVA